jgi:3-oxoacyl-[acyl-carrier-protein] synthase III
MSTTSISTRIVLRSIAWELGASADLSELPEIQQDPDKAITLQHLGIARFGRSDLSVADLAGRSCTRTLERARLAGADIDSFVYASTSFAREENYRGGLRRAHAALGLASAYPVGLFGSECANLPAALQVAADQVAAGRVRRALVVTTDRGEAGSRLMDGMVSVFSDGAASCLIEDGGERGYLLEAITLHVATGMADVEPRKNLIAYLKGSMDGAVKTVRRCAAEVDAQMSDFKHVVMGNYNRSVLRTYAGQLGLNEGQIYAANVAAHGHVYAADPLIGLQSLVDDGQVRRGDRCLLLGSGLGTWGAIAVRVLEPDSSI